MNIPSLNNHSSKKVTNQHYLTQTSFFVYSRVFLPCSSSSTIVSSPCLSAKNDLKRQFRWYKQTWFITSWIGSLPSENFKMRQKARSFYRTENKESGKEKWKTSDCLGPNAQPCLEWEDPKLIGIWGLGVQMYCISSQEGHLQGYKSFLSFSLLTWHSGQVCLHVGSENLFQQHNTRKMKVIKFEIIVKSTF